MSITIQSLHERTGQQWPYELQARQYWDVLAAVIEGLHGREPLHVALNVVESDALDAESFQVTAVADGVVVRSGWDAGTDGYAWAVVSPWGAVSELRLETWRDGENIGVRRMTFLLGPDEVTVPGAAPAFDELRAAVERHMLAQRA